MIFIFGSSDETSRILDLSVSPCAKCDGHLDRIETHRRQKICCCIPVMNQTEQLVSCQKCGYRIRAVHFDQQNTLGGESNTAATTAAAAPVAYQVQDREIHLVEAKDIILS